MNDLDLSALNHFMNSHKREYKSTGQKNIKKKNTKPQNLKPDSPKYENRKQAARSSGKLNSKNKRVIQENPDLAYAPYNFVPLWKNVIEYRGQIASQSALKNDLMSGEIVYELKAVTDIFIDSGLSPKGNSKVSSFYKTAKGQYAVPGSTMRGLIRSNAQILSLSSLKDDIDDYSLMYRDVTGGVDKEKYGTILGAKSEPVPVGNGKTVNLSILKNVKGGYLEKKAGNYYICRTVVDKIDDVFNHMNYYVISERQILDEYVAALKKGKESSFSHLVDSGKLQHLPVKRKEDLDRIEEDILKKGEKSSIRIESKEGCFVKYYDSYRDVDKKDKSKIKFHYRGKRNSKYCPCFEKVSYRLKNDRTVTAIGKPGKYEKEGYVMLTGPMQEKKAVYIIPRPDHEKERIRIKPESIKAFEIDYNKRLNTIGSQSKDRKEEYRKFYALPEEGEQKPVFYIEPETAVGIKQLYFGYTPRLRLYYDYTVKDGITASHKQKHMDYCKAMFGYSDKEESRKSRVSFSDAVVMEEVVPLESRSLVLSEPKTTDFYNYLEQEEEKAVKTYNDDEFQIRGVKQYHLKKKAMMEDGEDAGNKAVQSSFCPLPEKTVFRGKVRFHNLREDELGLLLWSMRLEKDSLMNIGKAKAYGYGAVKMNILSVREFHLKKAYDLAAGLDLFPYKELDPDPLIENYKSTMNIRLNPETIDKHPSVIALLTMKNQNHILENEKTSYMDLKKFGKQKQNCAALPHLSQLYPTT